MTENMKSPIFLISAVVCPPPPHIHHGQWTSDGALVYQTVITYKCLTGYIFPHRVQQLEVPCSANGTWDKALPDCKGEEYTHYCGMGFYLVIKVRYTHITLGLGFFLIVMVRNTHIAVGWGST